jgi:hypothetical protein
MPDLYRYADCQTCHGTGEVLLPDWLEYGGMLVRYPAGDECKPCPDCGGEGVTATLELAHWFKTALSGRRMFVRHVEVLS